VNVVNTGTVFSAFESSDALSGNFNHRYDEQNSGHATITETKKVKRNRSVDNKKTAEVSNVHLGCLNIYCSVESADMLRRCCF
jgi:hypothetical protein